MCRQAYTIHAHRSATCVFSAKHLSDNKCDTAGTQSSDPELQVAKTETVHTGNDGKTDEKKKRVFCVAV